MSALESVSDRSNDEVTEEQECPRCPGSYLLLAAVAVVFASLALTALACEPADQELTDLSGTEDVFGIMAVLENAEESAVGPTFLWCPLFTAGMIVYDDGVQYLKNRVLRTRQEVEAGAQKA